MAMAHVPLAQLTAGLDPIRRSPSDAGRIELIVRRPQTEVREVVAEARLCEDEGLVGDRWIEGAQSAGDGYADTQITIMNARSIALIAADEARWALAGDQLYVDLDPSETNTPPGTRLQVGSALLEVTAEPHRGCGNFSRRFGVDALKLVNSEVGRTLNLRGINARVVRGGTVRTGDTIRKELA